AHRARNAGGVGGRCTAGPTRSGKLERAPGARFPETRGFRRPRSSRSNASERKGRSPRRGEAARAAAPPPNSKIARKTQAAKNLRFRAAPPPQSLCKGKVVITSN